MCGTGSQFTTNLNILPTPYPFLRGYASLKIKHLLKGEESAVRAFFTQHRRQAYNGRSPVATERP
jgi:hypothetical protein